ncbi:nucleotide exchange factor GrpE [Methanimicrococcus sp. OttesenSCG-928-J09]|nr:nucleotide exchange factor GrpE [Methanimicrococcus sp. OttesenSCG-928-J09]
MNNTKYEDDALLEVDSDESDDSGSFMSECIPEEDGDMGSIDGGNDSAAGQDGTQASGSLAGENAALLKRVEDLTSAYLTLAADFENYKKRNQKHMEDVKKFAGEPIMIDMIEVADNFERAIASAEKETADKESLMEGVKNTYRQFMTLLGKHGLSRVPSEPGTEFDPHLHESVAQVPTTDYPDETIMNVFKPGYTLNTKVIRPATVTVSTYPDED